MTVNISYPLWGNIRYPHSGPDLHLMHPEMIIWSNCRIALTVMDHLGGLIKHLISLISWVTNNSLTLARNVGKLLEFGQNAGEIILFCNFTRHHLITHTDPVNSNFLVLF